MKLRILSTSDTHGYIAPTNYVKPSMNMPFGLEKAATTIKKEQAKADAALILDNGDFLEGSPLAYYEAKIANQDGTNAINDAFNEIPFDYGSLGNHEFNYGQNYLKKTIKNAKRPILCANILSANGKPAFGEPYAIKHFGDLKVGILGVTTQAINQWENKDNINGLQFISAKEAAQRYLPEMKKKADINIVLYHGGFERDKNGRLTEKFAGENESYELLKTIPGIDALVTGHQHRHLADRLFGVPFVQPGYRADNVGEIDLNIEKRDDKYHVINSSARLVPTGNESLDKSVVNAIHPTEVRIEHWLSTPLSHITGSMNYSDPFWVRTHGGAFINFIQKIQMEEMDADISATALFTDEAHGFENPITMRNVITNYVYPNTLSVVQISGADLKAALEEAANYFVIDQDGQIAENPAYYYPKRRDYNYDMYRGINYTLDVSKPVGSRLIELTYHGKPVSDNQKLRVVLNTYRAFGGGHYSMFSDKKVIACNQKTMSDLIAEYLFKHPEIKADDQSNFKVIK